MAQIQFPTNIPSGYQKLTWYARICDTLEDGIIKNAKTMFPQYALMIPQGLKGQWEVEYIWYVLWLSARNMCDYL